VKFGVGLLLCLLSYLVGGTAVMPFSALRAEAVGTASVSGTSDSLSAESTSSASKEDVVQNGPVKVQARDQRTTAFCGLTRNATQQGACYEHLAGVLAGFVFTAIVLFLTNKKKIDSGGMVQWSLELLLVTFYMLVLSSFLYALAVSYDEKDPAIYTHSMFAGAVFLQAIMLVSLSVAWLVKGHEAPDSTVRMTLRMSQAALLFTTVGMASIADATTAMLGLRIIWVSIAFYLAALLSSSMGLAVHARHRQWTRWPEARLQTYLIRWHFCSASAVTLVALLTPDEWLEIRAGWIAIALTLLLDFSGIISQIGLPAVATEGERETAH
jgi:hypothetical protein